MDNQPQGTPSIDERLAAYDARPADPQPTTEPSPTPETGKETTPEPLPSSNDAPEEGQTAADTTEGDSSTDEGANGSDDADPKTRTRDQFQKLLDSNRDLKRELDALKNPQAAPQGTSALDNLIPRPSEQAMKQAASPRNFPALDQTQIDSLVSQFISADDNGDEFINKEGLSRALYEANALAQRAEARAAQAEQKIERYEEGQQVREAHSQFPQLDPKAENFDRGFYNAVRNQMLYNYAYNTQQSFADAATEVSAWYKPATTPPVTEAKVREDAVNDYKSKQQEKRKLAPIERGKGAPRKSEADMETLHKQSFSKSKRERDNAIDQRMRRAGIL